MNEITVIPESPAENSVLESSISASVAVTPPPVWVTPVPPRPQILFPCIVQHVTFVQETPEPMDQLRDMFESSMEILHQILQFHHYTINDHLISKKTGATHPF